MFAIRSSLRAGFGAALLVLGGATAAHAGAYPDDVEEKKATEIYGFVCEDDGSAPRSFIWYRRHSEIQQQAPYEWVRDLQNESPYPTYNPFEDTMFELYGDKFNPKTREKMCADPVEFARSLQNNVVDHKGKIKSCCATEDGVEEFFEKKLEAQIANNEQQAEALDDEDAYKEKYKDKDPEFEYLHIWTCKPESAHC
ncbi:hypothetical protein V7968_17530 [Nocardia vulneris]|uniref:hypothetical protein n=1 Tax=Nocardia vulneris TaxID=1141657 RepID=UPI0030D0F703